MIVYFVRPRQLPIPGADYDNVCLLRTPDDANKIAEAAKGKKVVIIGSSFIGMYYSTINIEKQNISIEVKGAFSWLYFSFNFVLPVHLFQAHI